MMKMNEYYPEKKATCKTVACLKCELCNAVNYEERRVVKPEVKQDIRSLYGAEVLSYDFYFMPRYKLA